MSDALAHARRFAESSRSSAVERDSLADAIARADRHAALSTSSEVDVRELNLFSPA